MKGRLSAKVRWGLWVALAVAIGIGLAMLLERREPLENRVLESAPSDASVVLYTELAPLRKSDTLGRLVRQRLSAASGLAMVEPDVDALALAVGTDEIVGLAAGRFPLSLVRRYLEQNGAACPAALDERACALPAVHSGNLVSIRALDSGLLGVTAGPRPDGADRLAAAATFGPELAARARAALDGGALVWIWIEPRRLADTMSDPPEGWINLSLIARALLSAQDASLSLRDGANATVDATLEAQCNSSADAEELAKCWRASTDSDGRPCALLVRRAAKPGRRRSKPASRCATKGRKQSPGGNCRKVCWKKR
ncbi:MAG: hypothetical protein R2724_33535 [Bryobacterales bacterium]